MREKIALPNPVEDASVLRDAMKILADRSRTKADRQMQSLQGILTR